MLPNYSIVRPSSRHLDALPSIERAAAELFSLDDLPLSLREAVTSVSAFTAAAEQGNLFVALSDLDVPVGFALLSMLDGMVFLKEMDVDPAHARKGIGRALLQAVVEHASSLELPGVLLTTYRHVPWNAPFYERFGFRIVGPDEMTPGLAAQLAREAEQGLDPKTRVGMVYRLAP